MQTLTLPDRLKSRFLSKTIQFKEVHIFNSVYDTTHISKKRSSKRNQYVWEINMVNHVITRSTRCAKTSALKSDPLGI